MAIARKDVRDARRSYWLWGLAAVLSVLLAIGPLLIVTGVIQMTQPQGGQTPTTDVWVQLMLGTLTFFVPIVAIVLAYESITGERDSGTLKLLLSLPHSRLDVVVGKAIGRGVVVTTAILIAFVVAALTLVPTPFEFAFANYVGFALLTVVLGLAFVGLSVGFSAAAETSRRAMIGTVTMFVLFTLIWSSFASGLTRLLRENTGLGSETLVPLHLFVKILNPTEAYRTLVISLLSGDPFAARVSLAGGAGLQGALNRQAYAQALGGSVPFYLSDPVMVLVLLFWIVVIPLAGYWAFEDADL
jgi:ABC-2 type transport system permease protein